MSDDRKYVRVYYNDLIRDYPDIWANDAALATWLRMLSTADPMWPTPPELPRTVRPRPLSALTASGLVSIEPLHRFRMKGMDAERTMRQDAARNAAAKRWHSGGSPPPNAEAMPNRAETSKPEPSKADAARDDDEPERPAITKLASWGATVRPDGNGIHLKLVDLVRRRGILATLQALEEAHKSDPQGSGRSLVFGAEDALDRPTKSKPIAVGGHTRSAQEVEDAFDH